jgi:hypothetical protein
MRVDRRALPAEHAVPMAGCSTRGQRTRPWPAADGAAQPAGGVGRPTRWPSAMPGHVRRTGRRQAICRVRLGHVRPRQQHQHHQRLGRRSRRRREHGHGARAGALRRSATARRTNGRPTVPEELAPKGRGAKWADGGPSARRAKVSAELRATPAGSGWKARERSGSGGTSPEGAAGRRDTERSEGVWKALWGSAKLRGPSNSSNTTSRTRCLLLRPSPACAAVADASPSRCGPGFALPRDDAAVRGRGRRW